MAGDVGRAQHLPTDATGDLAFMSDHVGAESVFGGESRGTGLQPQRVKGQRSAAAATTTTLSLIIIIIMWELTVMSLTVT